MKAKGDLSGSIVNFINIWLRTYKNKAFSSTNFFRPNWKNRTLITFLFSPCNVKKKH